MAVTVIGRTKVGAEISYIVLQPDGTRAQIPQWMFEPEAADLTVRVPHEFLCMAFKPYAES